MLFILLLPFSVISSFIGFLSITSQFLSGLLLFCDHLPVTVILLCPGFVHSNAADNCCGDKSGGVSAATTFCLHQLHSACSLGLRAIAV
jgi:ascorbate-specific PTS system EIIC-type component UlaA